MDNNICDDNFSEYLLENYRNVVRNDLDIVGRLLSLPRCLQKWGYLFEFKFVRVFEVVGEYFVIEYRLIGHINKDIDKELVGGGMVCPYLRGARSDVILSSGRVYGYDGLNGAINYLSDRVRDFSEYRYGKSYNGVRS